ncbi:MAG: hypothetical protein M3126_01090 [Candidatus Eremiobacteraeota bacterium]|nr:hypothetical protein [Candidatus Eremiobacteraeota bacterium]
MLQKQPLTQVSGSIHLCFPDERTKSVAMSACEDHEWTLEDERRPLCMTAASIPLDCICRIACALPRESRRATKATFIPAPTDVTAFIDYFNVNKLEELYARCEPNGAAHRA